MSKLENLEAKMANIEVSLSSSNPIRRRRGTSRGGTVSARNSPRLEYKELRSPLQDRETVIQNLRVQIGLEKCPWSYVAPPTDSERLEVDGKLNRLRLNAENLKMNIRNLKSDLSRLNITDNIDVRIRQAELEYALGQKELQLLSLVEEARSLQNRRGKSKQEANTLYSHIQSGFNLSLHAVHATVGRWDASANADSPGLYVEWSMNGEGLNRGDRILEVNGKIISCNSREELHKLLGSTGKCLLVVVRKQKLTHDQEDNIHLQHRISYLEDKLMDLQTSKELPNPIIANGVSGHVTSINISLPSPISSQKPKQHQGGNNFTTLVGGKPLDLNSAQTHVTKTLIKEDGCHTDTENIYLSLKNNQLTSKATIKSVFQTHSKKRNKLELNRTPNSGKYCTESNTFSNNRHNYARSVEHVNYNCLDHKKEAKIASHTRKVGSGLRNMKCSIFENEFNNEKYLLDYTSEPAAPRIRPIPPKKPLRLSLQRAQSLDWGGEPIERSRMQKMDIEKGAYE